jgi:hypothetical protein
MKMLQTAIVRMAVNPIFLAVTVPTGLQKTLDNLMTGGQVIGLGLAGVFLVIAAIQFMSGGRNAIEMSKLRIICIIVGVVLCAGCSVLKTFLLGLMAF